MATPNQAGNEYGHSTTEQVYSKYSKQVNMLRVNKHFYKVPLHGSVGSMITLSKRIEMYISQALDK